MKKKWIIFMLISQLNQRKRVLDIFYMEPKEKTKNNRDSILEEIAKNDNPSLYNKELTYKDALLIDDYGYSLIEYVSKY